MVVVLTLVLRVWRSGEFISKSVHDQIVAATTTRYTDLLDRFNQQQAAIQLWREHAERAAKAAETAQNQHGEMLKRLEAVQTELAIIHRGLEEFKDDFHNARLWRELDTPPRPGDPRRETREPRGRRPNDTGGD